MKQTSPFVQTLAVL